jgi:hypothetical protein
MPRAVARRRKGSCQPPAAGPMIRLEAWRGEGMAKRRGVDRGEVPDIDQVLLDLFAGQLLLERAPGPEAPVARPARVRPAAKAGTRRRRRSAASSARDG